MDGRPASSERYKRRNTIERAINKLKQARPVATRYDERGGGSMSCFKLRGGNGPDAPGRPGREVNAGDETESSSRKNSEETRQICRVFCESPGTRSNGG
ncbi:hypothetical protein [Streptomyces sp. NPDC016172]|uniref:hypothetical protein n=1 Tax=Streptomyces sp. NPDC016172 TaxID=3364964 RepID=UPI0036FCE6A1